MISKNSVLLSTVIVSGFVFNQGHEYAYLIKYLLMGMLFFPFLAISFPRDKTIYLHVLFIFMAMLGLSTFSYLLLNYWDSQIAIIAFLVAFTPTATAAPFVISLLNKNVDYVISSVIITNCLVAVSIPFILPMIVSVEDNVSAVDVLVSTMMVLLIPFVASQIIKHTSDKLTKTLVSIKNFPFFIWMVVLYLATSKASVNLLNCSTSIHTIVEIALVSLFICILNFIIGQFIGGEKYFKEASQSLGQKNTMFMTWVALEYVSPLAVLGPVFYLIFQNMYISLMLSMSSRKQVSRA